MTDQIEPSALYLTRQLVNGEWCLSEASDRLIEIVNPATESVIGQTPDGSIADVDDAVDAAVCAGEGWRTTSGETRAGHLHTLADLIERDRNILARDISIDVGSPIRLARGFQVALPVRSLRTAANLAESFAFEQDLPSGSRLMREPAGVVAAITPWNYPLHQVVAKVAYALAAGCTVVLKPSEVAPVSIWRLGELSREAGIPPGVFNIVGGRGAVVGEALVSHPDVRVVAVTGSTRTGVRVAKLAAEKVRRVSLELGGKGADLMLDDADPAAVAKAVVSGVALNTGQSCGALTRLLVPRKMLETVEQHATAAAAQVKMGDPLDESTRMGPLVSAAQRERVLTYIRNAAVSGARVLAGGAHSVPDGPGYFVPLTVLSDVEPGMPVHDEEIFGPVLSIVAYDNEDDAVRIANSTQYGLTGGVWSANVDRAMDIARRLDAGQVWINGKGMDPTAPFGGFKQSGLGRENGEAGLGEFLEDKVIVI